MGGLLRREHEGAQNMLRQTPMCPFLRSCAMLSISAIACRPSCRLGWPLFHQPRASGRRRKSPGGGARRHQHQPSAHLIACNLLDQGRNRRMHANSRAPRLPRGLRGGPLRQDPAARGLHGCVPAADDQTLTDQDAERTLALQRVRTNWRRRREAASGLGGEGARRGRSAENDCGVIRLGSSPLSQVAASLQHGPRAPAIRESGARARAACSHTHAGRLNRVFGGMRASTAMALLLPPLPPAPSPAACCRSHC